MAREEDAILERVWKGGGPAWGVDDRELEWREVNAKRVEWGFGVVGLVGRLLAWLMQRGEGRRI